MKNTKDSVVLKAPTVLKGRTVVIGSVAYKVGSNGTISIDPDYVTDHVPALQLHFASIEYEQELKAKADIKRKETTTVGQMRLLAEYLVEMFGEGLAQAMAAKAAGVAKPVVELPVDHAPEVRPVTSGA